jgi:hypothetical protein
MLIGTRGWTRDGETPTWLGRRELLSDLCTGRPHHQPIPFQRYSR